MCLATVTVTRAPSPPVEVKDVTTVDFEDGYVLVSTLFGEEHRFAGVAIRKIDTRKGVTISFEEEQSP
jgi:predicted RNA-binding protein